jgi:hypothetical protein
MLNDDAMKTSPFWFNNPGARNWAPSFRTRHVQKLAMVALLLAGLEPVLYAGTNWYVRSGAGGSHNGTDWNNAWTDVTSINWSSVAAGDSIWIAGGNYSGLTIGKSGTSGNYIYIARVRTTNSVPVAAAGWNSAYDAAVVIGGVGCDTYKYWTLDGQIPNSGILVSNGATWNAVHLSDGAGYCNLKNLLISGIATDSTMGGIEDYRCINLNYGGATAGHGLYVGYCTLQQYPTLISTLNMSDMTIEHCKLWHNWAGGSGYHPNTFQVTGGTNVIFRCNEVTEWLTEGIMMDFCGSGDAPNDNWDIYGNLWHDPIAGWYGRILEGQYRAQYRIRLYNNTLIGVYAIANTANGGSWGAGCASENNIAFNGSGGLGFGAGADDYNLSDGSISGTHSISGASSSIFVNYAGKNYHLASTVGAKYPKDKGVNLGSSYNADLEGNIRGADGTWDIGAYEYQAGTAVAPPTNLKIVSTAGP